MDQDQDKHRDKSQKLDFKPLNKGLGFHPFSDGMPYAPVVKRPPNYSTGTGAVSAGPARFVTPRLPQANNPNVPFQAHVRGAHTRSILTPQKLEIKMGFDYVLKRFLAYWIDFIFNTSICLIALSVVALQLRLDPRIFQSLDNLAWVGGFLLFFQWALLVAQEVAVGTSIGKRMFGLKLSGGPVWILFRAFLFPLSLLSAGVGVLMAVFDGKKRCLHDLLSGVWPEEIVSPKA